MTTTTPDIVGTRARVNPDATKLDGQRHPFAGRCGIVTGERRGGTLQLEVHGEQVQLDRKLVTLLGNGELSTDLPAKPMGSTAPAPAPVAGAGAAPAPADTQFAVLELSLIVRSKTNPRKHFDQVKLQELADSIENSGVGQPILVRPLPGNRVEETQLDRMPGDPLPVYELVAGERRYRASKLVHQRTIPAMVRAMTDAQVLEFQLVENLQRDDLQPLEEAEGYAQLMAETGHSAEEVGARIGKSKAYVYARLKLLDLCAEAREALQGGALDASRALRIARVPDHKLQLRALAYATEQDYRGVQKHGTRDVEGWIRDNVLLRLKDARFDLANADLCPCAGACTACPKHTGANPDLWNDHDGPDLCTDPPCFHAKTEAHDAAAVEAAAKLGKKVIAGAEARELMPHAHGEIKGYIRLDQPAYQVGVYSGSIRKELGKACPEPTIIVNPHDGKPVAVAKVSTVRKLLGERKAEKAEKQEAKRVKVEGLKPVAERPAYRNRWLRTVVDQVDTQLRAGTVAVPVELLRSMLLEQLQYGDDAAFGPALDLGDEFNSGEARRRLLALPDDDVPRTLMRWALHNAEENTHSSDDILAEREPRHTIPLLASATGVDILAVQADVLREMESEDRAAALEQEAERSKPRKAPKPEPAAAPAAPAPKAPAKGKAARQAAQQPTGKAEAAAGIAEALAAAEDATGPNDFSVGDVVRIKIQLKGPKGKLLSTAGLTAAIESQGGDRAWWVRWGPKDGELAAADYTELEHAEGEEAPAEAAAPAKAASKHAPKYRCAATGATWTGRGKKPRWVEVALADGKKLEDLAYASADDSSLAGGDEEREAEPDTNAAATTGLHPASAWPFPRTGDRA